MLWRSCDGLESRSTGVTLDIPFDALDSVGDGNRCRVLRLRGAKGIEPERFYSLFWPLGFLAFPRYFTPPQASTASGGLLGVAVVAVLSAVDGPVAARTTVDGEADLDPPCRRVLEHVAGAGPLNLLADGGAA